jgi:hypothetical protein
MEGAKDKSYMFKSKYLQSLNIYNAKITYDDFDIDPNIEFEKQRLSFKEDILQIKCDEMTLIDVGWYREFRKSGSFCIRIIENYDWDNPAWKKRTKSIKKLKQLLQQALDLCFKSRN